MPLTVSVTTPFAMNDIIGIGALNVDFIATRAKLLRLDPDTVPEFSHRFEHGVETKVNDKEIDETLTQMGWGTFEVFLGGSSFNTVHAIAHANPGLHLGYVGVAGNVEPAPQGFIEAMQALRIDTRFVLSRDENRAGRCVSYINEGERSLLTTPGVNVDFAEFASENKETLLDYLASAKLVHITSLFDALSPRILSSLIRDAKSRNPWLKVSFDPGHDWVCNRDESVVELLQMSDFVFLNNREFLTLGHHRPGTNDLNVARQIFRFCHEASVLVVLKRYDSISLFYRIQGRIMMRIFPNQILPQEVIEDATGAGDVFAAGFLTAMLVPGMEYSHGVELGLRLVRAKLLVPGYRCFDRYAGIFTNLINEITSFASAEQRRTMIEEKPPSIFIGHGHGPLWSIVERHLRGDLSLTCVSWETEPRTSQQVISVLASMLDAATFAVMVATGDDETTEGLRRARQNVLHEIGLFQGRLGFNRVVVMSQKGVEDFSNIAGLQVIQFDGNSIQQGFHELDQVLRRERVLV